MNKIKQDKQEIKDQILRITPIAQEAINKRIITLSKCFPVEFCGRTKFGGHRKLEIGRCTFILYSGLIVFKGVLSDEQNHHFCISIQLSGFFFRRRQQKTKLTMQINV
jgi:hypothetical protein